MSSKKNTQKSKGVIIKIIIVILSLFIMAIAAFFLNDTPFISKYMLSIRQTYSEIVNRFIDDPNITTQTYQRLNLQEMQEIVPFSVPTPKWIPKEYEFSDAHVSDFGMNNFWISYNYKNAADEQINFDVHSRDLGQHNILVNVDEIEIKGMKVLLLEIPTDKGYMKYSCMYKDNQGLLINIGHLDKKETLIKIIENLD